MIAPTFHHRVAALPRTGSDILSLHAITAHPAGPDNVLVRCPAHDDDHPSCSVNLRTGQAKCHACGFRAGDVVALHRALGKFTSMGDALRDLEARSGIAVPPLRLRPAPTRPGPRSQDDAAGNPEVVKAWTYRRADGSVAFEVRRIQFRLPDGTWEIDSEKGKARKTYRPFDPGTGRNGMPSGFDHPGSRPLFNLPAVVAADPAIEVFVTEGEPAADALTSIGCLATTSSGGAAAPERTDWSPLAGRHVVVWPDNDEAGIAYAESVTRVTTTLAPPATVRWVDIEKLGLARGADAVEWIARGGGK